MTKKRSLRVTLLLSGGLLLGCETEDTRSVYKSREDCLAEWNSDPAQCEEVPKDSPHYRSGYYYGPYHGLSRMAIPSASGALSHGNENRPSRAISTARVTRGGFGATGSSHSSFHSFG